MVLDCFQSLNLRNVLIVSDSKSALLSINSISFSADTSPLVLRIKSKLFHLHTHGFTVKFLWVPGHAGIISNEIADFLAVSTNLSIRPPTLKIPSSDYLMLLKKKTTTKSGKTNGHL